MKDQLFLLKPGFRDPAAGPHDYYCPHCAAVAGILGYHPEVRAQLDVHEVDFQRPRPAVEALLGPKHPGCPLLVLAEGREPPAGVHPSVAANGRRFLLGTADIAKYLTLAYGAGVPHP